MLENVKSSANESNANAQFLNSSSCTHLIQNKNQSCKKDLIKNDKYVSCDILNSHNSIFDQRDVGMQGNKKSECYKCLG